MENRRSEKTDREREIGRGRGRKVSSPCPPMSATPYLAALPCASLAARGVLGQARSSAGAAPRPAQPRRGSRKSLRRWASKSAPSDVPKASRARGTRAEAPLLEGAASESGDGRSSRLSAGPGRSSQGQRRRRAGGAAAAVEGPG